MTRFTDGTKTVEVSMWHWSPNGYSPEFSREILVDSVSGFTAHPLFDDTAALIVDNVGNVVDWVEAWERGAEEGGCEEALEYERAQGLERVALIEDVSEKYSYGLSSNEEK